MSMDNRGRHSLGRVVELRSEGDKMTGYVLYSCTVDELNRLSHIFRPSLKMTLRAKKSRLKFAQFTIFIS